MATHTLPQSSHCGVIRITMKNSLPWASGLLAVSLTLPSAAPAAAGKGADSSIVSTSAVKAHASTHADLLCVKGTVRRPWGHALPHGAHVDVELVDGSGRVIASSQDRLVAAHPRIERRRAGRYSFAACFPRPRQNGWSVRVSYHAHAHS
jgi:hypothetical protein